MKLSVILSIVLALATQAQDNESPKKYPSPDGSASIVVDTSGKRDHATFVAGSKRKEIFTGGDGIEKLFAGPAARALNVKEKEISKVSWPSIEKAEWISPQEAQLSGTVTISFLAKDDMPELAYKVSVTKDGAVKVVSLTKQAEQ